MWGGELGGADPAMFATTRSPHVAASQETLSRYVRNTMAEAGIDTEHFMPYSCHHAFTSGTARKQVPLATIIMAASWAGETTFRRFYDRPVREATPTVTNLIPDIWEQEGEAD